MRKICLLYTSVTLTATIKSGNVSETKTLIINVLEMDPTSDAEKALYDVNNVLIGGIDIANVKMCIRDSRRTVWLWLF